MASLPKIFAARRNRTADRPFAEVSHVEGRETRREARPGRVRPAFGRFGLKRRRLSERRFQEMLFAVFHMEQRDFTFAGPPACMPNRRIVGKRPAEILSLRIPLAEG